jgi:hypothetical protein
LRTRIEQFLDTRELRASTSKVVDGLWIGVSPDVCKSILSRIDVALQLIMTYDLLRYHRLLRVLDRIWVHLLNGNVAQFNRSLRACEIDTRFMLNEKITPEVLAGVLVHEGRTPDWSTVASSTSNR